MLLSYGRKLLLSKNSDHYDLLHDVILYFYEQTDEKLERIIPFLLQYVYKVMYLTAYSTTAPLHKNVINRSIDDIENITDTETYDEFNYEDYFESVIISLDITEREKNIFLSRILHNTSSKQIAAETKKTYKQINRIYQSVLKKFQSRCLELKKQNQL